MDQLLTPFKITEIRQENANNKTFVLDRPIEAQPGQFVMAWLPGMQDKPFSLAHANPLSLTIAAVGPLSEALHQLTAGDSIWVRGPLGRGYRLTGQPGDHLLLIGGGYGVAPLCYLAETALAAGYRVSAIVGARRQQDLLLVDAFEALGVATWATTEDGSAGLKGLVTDAIAPAYNSALGRPTAVYTCGPTGMLRAVAARCAADGIAVQVSWEAHMRCGIGLCGSCEVGDGWLTCLDGPVFSFDPEQVSPLATE
jgi:dihydroorotate dehydrogenase electron transfer subunit